MNIHSPFITVVKALSKFAHNIINSNKIFQIMVGCIHFNDKKNVSSDLVKQIQWDKNNRHEMRGFTFHIDPVGCLDVDDSFTFTKNEHGWDVSINIADVDAWIHTGTDIDSFAELRSTSFYCPDGKALAPMLPHIISEDMASLLPGNEKPVVSLQFDWIPGLPIKQYTWKIGIVKTDITYTYESVMKAIGSTPELQALCNLSVEFGAEAGDSHTWVEALMILYNEQVGALLRNHKKGIFASIVFEDEEFLAFNHLEGV
jgi:exoribonuclease R